MTEDRVESKIELCMRDISKDEAWMLTYIVVHMLKDKTCIRDIYQMLTGDDTDNPEVADKDIDFILLESLGHGRTAWILRLSAVTTEHDLVRFVYARSYASSVYRLGPSALADIAAYMKIRNLIPKDSDMSNVISHFMKGVKAAEALRLANVRYRNYMDAHK